MGCPALSNMKTGAPKAVAGLGVSIQACSLGIRGEDNSAVGHLGTAGRLAATTRLAVTSSAG